MAKWTRKKPRTCGQANGILIGEFHGRKRRTAAVTVPDYPMQPWHPLFAQLLRPLLEGYYEVQTNVPVGDAPRVTTVAQNLRGARKILKAGSDGHSYKQVNTVCVWRVGGTVGCKSQVIEPSVIALRE